MKQLLFLLLFPCFALAQYPGNAGQKITLGEQTTADGLVYRGVASADTIRKPSIDTMAFILLDTNTNIIWQYKKATNNAWTRVGGSISSGLTGVLPVANGGTGADMSSLPNNYLIRKNSSGVFDTSAVYEANGNVGINITTPNSKLTVNEGEVLVVTGSPTQGYGFNLLNTSGGAISKGRIASFGSPGGSLLMSNNGIYSGSGSSFVKDDNNLSYWDLVIDVRNGNDRIAFRRAPIGALTDIVEFMRIDSTGKVGIGTASPTEKLHVLGNARISGLANAANPVNVQVDVNGVLVRTSSIDIKEDVQSLPYGLNEIMLLQPSKFSYIDKYKYGEGYDIGFIAQDVNNVIPEAVGTGIESDIFMDSVKLIPVLTKAIQEQQALIKALEQRILILENK